MKIDKILQFQIREFCIKNHVILFVIFGSHARGTDNPNSDIDVALVLENIHSSVNKLKLIFELEGIFPEHVDLVIVTPNTDPLLLFEIFKNGISLYEGESDLFREYKLRAWKLFQDTKKIRDLKQQYITNYIGNLEHDFRGIE